MLHQNYQLAWCMTAYAVNAWLTGADADLCLSQWMFDWQVSMLTCVCHSCKPETTVSLIDMCRRWPLSVTVNFDWQVSTLTCVCHSDCLIDRCQCWLVSVTVTVWLTGVDSDLYLSHVGHCQRTSAKHAVIFYDQVSARLCSVIVII